MEQLGLVNAGSLINANKIKDRMTQHAFTASARQTNKL